MQRCASCGARQFEPEWACQGCGGLELAWQPVEPRGRIYSWERVWHPVHPALAEACPYVAVLVELPAAGGVRLLGNLLGDPHAPVEIGAEVEGVFEDREGYTLLQWRRA